MEATWTTKVRDFNGSKTEQFQNRGESELKEMTSGTKEDDMFLCLRYSQETSFSGIKYIGEKGSIVRK